MNFKSLFFIFSVLFSFSCNKVKEEKSVIKNSSLNVWEVNRNIDLHSGDSVFFGNNCNYSSRVITKKKIMDHCDSLMIENYSDSEKIISDTPFNTSYAPYMNFIFKYPVKIINGKRALANLTFLDNCFIYFVDTSNTYVNNGAHTNLQFERTTTLNYGGRTEQLYDCRFNDDLKIYFNEHTFYCTLVFEKTIFKTNIEFINDYIGVNIIRYFRGVKNSYFSSILFSNCKLGKKLKFDGFLLKNENTFLIENCILPDTIDFSNSTLYGKINLLLNNKLSSKNKCQINLLGTNVSNINLNYDNFHLYFPKEYLTNHKHDDEIAATYEALLSNFKNNGFINNFETLDVEYNIWKTRWYNIFGWINLVWWEFGHSKWLICVWTVNLIFLFSLINNGDKRYLKLQETYPIENLKYQNTFSLTSKFSKWLITVLYTSFIFFKFNINFKNINFKNKAIAFWIIFQYTIGLVCTGFLINWIIK